MTKERPILFSGEMVRAILEGRKTQTRRVIKPQPDDSVTGLVPRRTPAGNVLWGNALWETKSYGTLIELQPRKCPYGQPGDRLWVRETWTGGYGSVGQPAPGYVSYRADGEMMECYRETHFWRPSIFMPRWASRLMLEVTGVRVERVQDISEADAAAEGVDFARSDDGDMNAFNNLWDSINGKRGFGWDINPWVWVVEFKQAQP